MASEATTGRVMNGDLAGESKNRGPSGSRHEEPSVANVSVGPRSFKQLPAPALVAADEARGLRSQVSSQYLKQGNFLSVP